jgi:hypothetical protein
MENLSKTLENIRNPKKETRKWVPVKSSYRELPSDKSSAPLEVDVVPDENKKSTEPIAETPESEPPIQVKPPVVRIEKFRPKKIPLPYSLPGSSRLAPAGLSSTDGWSLTFSAGTSYLETTFDANDLFFKHEGLLTWAEFSIQKEIGLGKVTTSIPVLHHGDDLGFYRRSTGKLMIDESALDPQLGIFSLPTLTITKDSI